MKIAYNAGHILSTPGKRLPKELDANETREWVLNDRVARYFAEAMGQYGGVELKRMDDPAGIENIDIDVRVARANVWGADFYLSIHHNAAGRIFSGGGVTVFIDAGGGPSEEYARAIYEEIVADTGLKGDRSDPIVTGDEQSLYEVRATTMPAVLVEYGFMDSTADAPVILTEEYAKKAGYATARAIARVAGLEEGGMFSDVDASKWYADEVEEAAALGLMEGTGGGKFESERPVTRAELAAVAVRLHKLLAGE